MTLTGKQKAAILLMNLDTVTAAKMIKDLNSKVVQDLALELAYLDATGYRSNNNSVEIAQQFCNSLFMEKEFHIDNFLNELLISTVGAEISEQIQAQIRNMLHKRDPFLPIRSVNADTIASVLDSEHPQAIAVVLSELPAKKSSEVLGLLSEDARFKAIGRMAISESITLEAKTRIAETICKRLEMITSKADSQPVQAGQEQSLRKVAVILRNLSKELRDGLLDAIKAKDTEAGTMVTNFMIIWEDIPLVTDRSLQEALRGIDSRKLALALQKADENIIKKIRANISERGAAALDEEISLMSSPKKEDIQSAKDEFLDTLRQMNEKGELAFIEE